MIERYWIMPVTFYGTIVDIETSSLTPKDGSIITFGYFSAGAIKVHQRTIKDEDFEEFVRRSFSFLSRPYYAYNAKGFEEPWLEVRFDYDLMIKWRIMAEDITANGNMLRKWPSLRELISIPYEYFGKIENSGSAITKLWKRYLDTEDERLLSGIIHHNRHDLIRECCLLLWDDNTRRLVAEIMQDDSRTEDYI